MMKDSFIRAWFITLVIIDTVVLMIAVIGAMFTSVDNQDKTVDPSTELH